MFSARQIFAFPFAVAITFGLFWTMQFLISVDLQRPIDPIQTASVDIWRSIPDETVNRTPPKPIVKPDDAVPPPLDMTPQKVKPGSDRIAIGPNTIDEGVVIDPIGSAGADRDILPIVMVPPQYPSTAMRRGIEGWVTVELTVAPDGSVLDPVIVDHSPSGIFDRAALRAVKKWKYKPKVVNGKAVSQTGVQAVITFALDQ